MAPDATALVHQSSEAERHAQSVSIPFIPTPAAGTSSVVAVNSSVSAEQQALDSPSSDNPSPNAVSRVQSASQLGPAVPKTTIHTSLSRHSAPTSPVGVFAGIRRSYSGRRFSLRTPFERQYVAEWPVPTTGANTCDLDAEQQQQASGRAQSSSVSTQVLVIRSRNGITPSRPQPSGHAISPQRLGDILRESLARSAEFHKQFLPRSHIYKPEIAEAMKATLHKPGQTLRNKLQPWKSMAEPTIGTYQKIFVILSLMGRPSKIRSFVKCGLRDVDLPLEKVSSAIGARDQHHLRSKARPGATLRCFKKRHDMDEFVRTQWCVLAPDFDTVEARSIPHRSLDTDAILPFVSMVQAECGGHGQVYQVKTHPDHHTFGRSQASNVFAVKQLKSKKVEAFESEARILRRLSGSFHAHAHLINLLGTYTYEGKHHLIFPWAEADLSEYWKNKVPQPPKTADRASWIAAQCHGLAEGLNRIHRYDTASGTSLLGHEPDTRIKRADRAQGDPAPPRRLFGRHGDLKPENILWFPDPRSIGGHGILKITDFGIARFSSENAVTARVHGLAPNSATYRSPECDLPHGKLSTACDIWALGCVFLEFVTWYFGGQPYRITFGARRLATDPDWAGISTDTFFTIETDSHTGRRKAKVKEAVTQMIDELRHDSACDNFFSEFLDIIENEMLVVHQDEPESEAVSIRAESHDDAVSEARRSFARRKSSGDIFRSLGKLKDELTQKEARLEEHAGEAKAEVEVPMSSTNGRITTLNALPGD